MLPSRDGYRCNVHGVSVIQSRVGRAVVGQPLQDRNLVMPLDLADRGAAAVTQELATLPRAAIAAASGQAHGAVIVVRDWDEAVGLVNRLAPEHLQLMVRDPTAVFAGIRHAGAVFLGAFCPEAVGDYVAGPNHVLPTSRTARFASGLSVFDFLKRTTWVEADAAALARVGPAAIALAEAEGLDAHARSIALRLSA